MPEWPHEYIVRGRVDEQLFIDLVPHAWAHGHGGRFYEKVLVYYEEDGRVYWTMGAPIDETTIVNRCRTEDTYESRLAAATPTEAVQTVQTPRAKRPRKPLTTEQKVARAAKAKARRAAARERKAS